MLPNLFEYCWQIESTATEERATRAAAHRDATLSRPGRTRQLLGTLAQGWRRPGRRSLDPPQPLTVTGTDQNRG